MVSGLLLCSYVCPLSVSRSAGGTEDRKMRQKATEEVLFCSVEHFSVLLVVL